MKTTTINISPKVLTGLLVGIGIAAVAGITAAVTPDTFAFLGPWAPAAFSVFSILLGSFGAWLKREQAEEAIDAGTAGDQPPVINISMPASTDVNSVATEAAAVDIPTVAQ